MRGGGGECLRFVQMCTDRFVDELAGLLGLREGGGDEFLAAEAGVDRHEEDDVDLVHDVLAVVERLHRFQRFGYGVNHSAPG